MFSRPLGRTRSLWGGPLGCFGLAGADAEQRQARRLASAAPRLSQGPFHSQLHTVSAVLTGDFNFRPTDPLHARLTAEFGSAVPALDDVWRQLHPAREQPPTNCVHDREQWPEPYACDFICASRDLRERLRGLEVDGNTQASDHQPMKVELA